MSGRPPRPWWNSAWPASANIGEYADARGPMGHHSELGRPVHDGTAGKPVPPDPGRGRMGHDIHPGQPDPDELQHGSIMDSDSQLIRVHVRRGAAQRNRWHRSGPSGHPGRSSQPGLNTIQHLLQSGMRQTQTVQHETTGLKAGTTVMMSSRGSWRPSNSSGQHPDGSSRRNNGSLGNAGPPHSPEELEEAGQRRNGRTAGKRGPGGDDAGAGNRPGLVRRCDPGRGNEQGCPTRTRTTNTATVSGSAGSRRPGRPESGCRPRATASPGR